MPDFPIKTIKLASPGNYPKLLREINRPPEILYYRGNLAATANELLNLAIVGSRKMTDYGRQCVELLITGLRGLPVCVISGLAYGIDAHAHKTALDVGLKTIAVLGSGIDDESIYPRANKYLAHLILQSGGAIVSAYPPGSEALDWHFPERNQIISGLSHGTVIIEAAEKSGALITADFALDQNRDIFACPGSIFQNSSVGTNKLIKNSGAQLISSAADIINEYPALRKSAATAENKEIRADLTEIQRKILENIGQEPIAFNAILNAVGIAADQLNANLILLEIKNKIKVLGGNFYVRNLTNINRHG